MKVMGDWLAFGASLKWPLEKLHLPGNSMGIEKTGKMSKGTSTVSYIKQNILFSFFVYAKDSFSFFEVWSSEVLYQHLIKQPPEDVS